MGEFIKEFREFILKGNAFDLAVGVIIGAAFSGVVGSLVTDILLPPIGMLVGGADFSSYNIDLTALIHQVSPGLTPEKHAVIAYGKFINAIINLLIVGFVIFLLVKQINRFKKEAPKASAEKPEDVRLLAEIRDLLAAKGGETPRI